MQNDLCYVTELLTKYHQEHLLSFYNNLSKEQQSSLLNQIVNIPFSDLHKLYENSKLDDFISLNSISPIPYVDTNELSFIEKNTYIEIGNSILANHKLAVITLAGGQGTRLGYKGPKGCFELKIPPKKSLFEIACDSLKQAKQYYNVTIPWYIMTSLTNDLQTKQFFREKSYFSYPISSLFFFHQRQLPIIDTQGKLLLEEPYLIKEASNGNGDVFYSLYHSGLLDDMKSRGIEWVFIGGIDNVLLKSVDPLFLGLTASSSMKVASKCLWKQDINNKDWVFAKVNGRPSIIDPQNLTPDMLAAVDSNGNDLYRNTNMLAHLFHISALEKLKKVSLPYHRAFKKNTFVNEECMKEVPNAPNSFKFEKFIFDSFSSFSDLFLFRVSEEEFAPIKSFNGIYTPETAIEAYQKIHYKKNSKV